jgi:hypothetical protein
MPLNNKVFIRALLLILFCQLLFVLPSCSRQGQSDISVINPTDILNHEFIKENQYDVYSYQRPAYVSYRYRSCNFEENTYLTFMNDSLYFGNPSPSSYLPDSVAANDTNQLSLIADHVYWMNKLKISATYTFLDEQRNGFVLIQSAQIKFAYLLNPQSMDLKPETLKSCSGRAIDGSANISNLKDWFEENHVLVLNP